MADIKRLNGLVTDLQMFALKTLKIPLPGKHPVSPTWCNGQETQRYFTLILICIIFFALIDVPKRIMPIGHSLKICSLCYQFDLFVIVG